MKKLALALLIGIICTMVMINYSNKVQANLAKNLIRFHVVANSDSVEDQQLKLKVRDRIIKELDKDLNQGDGINATKQFINDNLAEIERIAEDEIKKNGKDYSVSATLGTYPFPTKVYGDVSLPSGNYEALRVAIGDAQGQNWWCVLFPPLCFVDGSYEEISQDGKEKLKNVLTQDEYNIITNTDKENEIPVEIRFKVVELWQNSKIKTQMALER